MAPPPPDLTVVVLGYRNGATIVDAVTSVVGQDAGTVDGDRRAVVEVVVVTSGGDDSAAALAAAHPSVAVIEADERLLPGAARNRGVAASSGGIVAFLAADCVAEPGWAAARLRAHRGGHPVVAGAMTAVPPLRPSAWASHVALFAHRLPGRPAGPVVAPDPAAHGLSFARTVLDRVGPFDESLRVGEDTELAGRLAAEGIPVWFEPAVRTAHRGPAGFGALVRSHHARGVRAARAAGEGRRPVGRPRAVLAAVRSTVVRTWSVSRAAWVGEPEHRGRTLACLPWVVAAQASSAAGRAAVRTAAPRAARDRRGSAGSRRRASS